MIHPLLQKLIENQDPDRPSMESFYRRTEVSRQAHSQWYFRYLKQSKMNTKLIDEVIQYRRTNDCRAGSRHLFYNLKIKERYDIGVTKFEQLMSQQGLSLPVVRVKVVTTKSSRQSWNYKNLVSGLKVTDINQVIVGDITYLHHNGLRYYFFGEKDVYSARLVGWSLSMNMKAENAEDALNMVIACRGSDKISGSIHHSDGGGQYFSTLFLTLAEANSIRMSRAKTCLENGYAEQFNAYLKHHMLPLIKSRSIAGMKQELSKLIHHYNHLRKQEELGWMSPVEFEKSLSIRKRKKILRMHDFDYKRF
ncbi:MAG: IS3 family transposase [Flavobacteriales bacterium]|nr:IS3 family transposase [Flavobacteriales bacterium]